MAARGRGNDPDASASSHTQPLAIKGCLIEKTPLRCAGKVQPRLCEYPNLVRLALPASLSAHRALKVLRMILMLCRPLQSRKPFVPTWASLSAALAGRRRAAGRVCSAVISGAACVSIGGEARGVFIRYAAVICEQNIDGKEAALWRYVCKPTQRHSYVGVNKGDALISPASVVPVWKRGGT